MKRNIGAFSMAVLLLLSLVGCSFQQTDFKDVKIDYASSELHSKEDIDNAANEVFDVFSEFDDAVLYSLEYSGDEISSSNIDYCQELLTDKKIVDCIVFKSHFKTTKHAKAAWVPNEDYYWDWCVAKDDQGYFTVATYGYC